MPVFLEELFGRLPPAFPFHFGKDVADQPFGDLRDGGVTACALENIPNARGWGFPGQFFDRVQVARLTREKMFWRDGGEIFRRVLQLHRVRFLTREIDDDLVEEQIPLGDAAEAPAFMQTKSPGFEFIELLSGFCS